MSNHIIVELLFIYHKQKIYSKKKPNTLYSSPPKHHEKVLAKHINHQNFKNMNIGNSDGNLVDPHDDQHSTIHA